jgi:predicted O-methyltransferase YrrM
MKKLLEAGWAATKILGLGLNVKSLSQIRNPRKMLRYCGECLFVHKTIFDGRGLQQKNVFEVLSSDGVRPVLLGNLRADGGIWFRPEASYTVDLVSLCLICQLIQPRKIFEIGTFTGYTAYEMALNSPEGARVFSLDLPPETEIKLKTTMMDDSIIETHKLRLVYAFSNSPAAEKITLLFGDSAVFDFSPYHGSIDLFFIDGSHSYEYVRSDTLNALKCCHPGSVVAWHDFGRSGVNGVSRWLSELSKELPIYCVPGGSLAFAVV